MITIISAITVTLLLVLIMVVITSVTRIWATGSRSSPTTTKQHHLVINLTDRATSWVEEVKMLYE
jgi:hypothetical protein